MGFLARFAIVVGIVYWLAPVPEGYRSTHENRQEQERAVEVLAALTGLSARQGASRDEIEALAVKAGQALAALDPKTRQALIDRYFGPGGDSAALRDIVN